MNEEKPAAEVEPLSRTSEQDLIIIASTSSSSSRSGLLSSSPLSEEPTNNPNPPKSSADNSIVIKMNKTAKFVDLFNRYVVILPLGVYVASSFLFFPIFQELIYQKSCLSAYNHSVEHCSNRTMTRSDHVLQTMANRILLLSNLCLTLPSLVMSILLGLLSDRFSRKASMLIPFCALILSDFTFLMQTVYMNSSPYWFLLSEGIFGLGGGYTSIFGTLFAQAAQSSVSKNERSRKMAILEGTMGLGGTIGYLSTGPLLQLLSFSGVFLFSLVVHVFCFTFILVFIKDVRPSQRRESREERQSLTTKDSSSNTTEESWRLKFIGYFQHAISTPFKRRAGLRRPIILLTLLAFGISYMVFSGSTDILFYYLKHQINGSDDEWTTAKYGYLKGCIYGFGTLMTLIVYPLMKYLKLDDAALALVGLVARMGGRCLLAFVKTTWMVFLLVPCDMFSRWGAASMRSILSGQVTEREQGRIFGTIALLEGLMDLCGSLIFNNVYPASLSFLPELSYIILTGLMIVPIGAIVYTRSLLMKAAKDDNDAEICAAGGDRRSKSPEADLIS